MRRRDAATEPYEVTQFVTEVGARVRLMRLARGLTQAELAERTDMSRLTLMSIEGGALSSRFVDVARILWALDDVSLQAAMATAAQDPAFQEAARANLPRYASRRKKDST